MTKPVVVNTSIRDYYEQNTRLFKALGGSSKVQSIHRSLWPPGVTSLDQALNVSNQLLLEAFAPISRDEMRPFLFGDLGCGLGGTLLFLLQQLPAPALGVGLTISPTQARMTSSHLRLGGKDGLGTAIEGDFLALPLRAGFDALVSIEAFVHAPEPRRYLSEAARVLRPGGRLVLVDDFLPGPNLPPDPDQRAWLQAYRVGWRVPGLSALPALIESAAGLGLALHTNLDLTPWLRFRTLPNLLTRWILALGMRIPAGHAILPSMLGSLALQHCLKARLVEYHLLVFEKRP